MLTRLLIFFHRVFDVIGAIVTLMHLKCGIWLCALLGLKLCGIDSYPSSTLFSFVKSMPCKDMREGQGCPSLSARLWLRSLGRCLGRRGLVWPRRRCCGGTDFGQRAEGWEARAGCACPASCERTASQR